MIRRIHIQRYKSLRNVDVALQPLSVLFGPNAAGKSNFIDALQLLCRIAGSRSLKEAFEPPYRGKPMESFSFGETGMEGLMKEESVSFQIEADIDLSPAVIAAVNKDILETKRGQTSDTNGADSKKPTSFIHHTRLRYRIEVGISPRSGVVHVADEYLVALGLDGQPKSRPQPFLERVSQRIHLRMEGQSHPTYFDRYLDHAIVSRPHYAPHYPHLTALKKELQSWFFYYFEPRERMRAPTSVKEVRHIGLMGEELAAFLNTLRNLDPPQFKAVEKALHSLIPSITGILTEVNKVGEVELSLMEGTVAMPAPVVSEGTLRTLGLLALSGVKEPPAVIGFEEPENGVHPRRIRDIAKILESRAESGNTQLIVTTHSPVLLDHIPDECAKRRTPALLSSRFKPGARSRAVRESTPRWKRVSIPCPSRSGCSGATLMPEITLFCEDSFHEKFIGALLRRFENENQAGVKPRFLSAQGGLPRMHGEFRDFLRDLDRDRESLPDSVIVVADANCQGYNGRKGQMDGVLAHYPQFQQLVTYAIPDPHIERWMLVDATAFQSVFGRGCTLPAMKCAKGEYKRLLRAEVRDSGIEAPLGGEEFAEDIVMAMDLGRVERASPRSDSS